MKYYANNYKLSLLHMLKSCTVVTCNWNNDSVVHGSYFFCLGLGYLLLGYNIGQGCEGAKPIAVRYMSDIVILYHK